MPRLKLTLAYVGTNYCGWQRQSDPTAKTRSSIQECVEAAFFSILQKTVTVHASGRTDAGVHALGQVCHTDIEERHMHIQWLSALNHFLPKDIVVKECSYEDASFHARIAAQSKSYIYNLSYERLTVFPHIAPYVWALPPLDNNAMQKAAELFIGEHDFVSFQNKGTVIKSTIRTIYSFEYIQNSYMGLSCPADWHLGMWRIRGNGFLKQMVRNLMGLLVWVGQKKLSPADAARILKQKSRQSLVSPVAPAQGLCLEKVYY